MRLLKIPVKLKIGCFYKKSRENTRHLVGGFNKTVIPLALVGYDMVIAGADYFPSKGSNRLLVIANSTLRALLAMFHLISNAHSWNNC